MIRCFSALLAALRDILEEKCTLPLRKKMHLIHLTRLPFMAAENDLRSTNDPPCCSNENH